MSGEGGSTGGGDSRGLKNGAGRSMYKQDNKGFSRGIGRGFRGSGKERMVGETSKNNGSNAQDSEDSHGKDSKEGQDEDSQTGNESKSMESDAKEKSKYVESKDLACKIFRIQSKRYYIIVKENKYGKFIKVIEISADGRRNKMNLTMTTAAKLLNELSSFGEFYASLGPEKPETAGDDGLLKEAVIIENSKRYFLDFKANDRVRFLRVSQVLIGGTRSTIAIPAMGIIEWRNNLSKLLEEFGDEERLPEGRRLKVRNNKFYFDIERSSRGVNMRVSQVGNNFRTDVTVPKEAWEEFSDIFDDYVIEMKEAVENIDDDN